MQAHRRLVAVEPGRLPPGMQGRDDPPGRPLDRQGWKAAASRLLATAAFLLVVACATEAKYRTYVDGFIGQNADQLYAVWGAPLRSAPTPYGGQVVSFLTNVQGGRGFGVAGCETSFILDRGGTVRQANFRGDACYKD
jgi:hypothetical protein